MLHNIPDFPSKRFITGAAVFIGRGQLGYEPKIRLAEGMPFIRR